MIESDVSGDECPEHVDGVFQENAPRMVQGDVEQAIAFDPEDIANVEEPPTPEDYAPVNPDLHEAPALDDAAEAEIKVEDNKPPKGWRTDRFGYRMVSTPPWSLRPPKIEPEVWLIFNKKQKEQLRQEWAQESPEEFQRQEERRKIYQSLKRAGKAGTVSASRPA